jgi:cytoskeleton protein RodZ
MEHDTSPGRAVGRLLRDQRLSRDLTLEAVAARLRIRSRYLEAIEQGRFDQLPGAAYIPAFLRAYANHLGLDPDKVLVAYQLSGAVPISRPVSLPAGFPIVEKRAPIGLAVLTTLLVFAAGYAVWHYLPHQQTVVSQKVPPVPDRLLATPAPPVQPSQAAAQPSAPQPSAPPVQEVRVPAPPPAPAPSANPAEMWPAPKIDAVKSEPASPPAAAPTPAPPAAAKPDVATAPPPVVLSAPSAGQAQAAQAPVVEQPRPVPAAPAPVTQEAVARSAPDQGNTATLVSPPMRADTRVAVRTNSWIELRGPAGDVLTQTYVRAGESYVVPAGISYRIIDAR